MLDDIKDPNKYAQQLVLRIWTTRGARFNAARRLTKKHQYSISSISILSTYAIAISALQLSSRLDTCPEINEIYSLIAIVLSVFTLVFSLLEGSQDYQGCAKRLHANAVCMSTLLASLNYCINNQSESSDYCEHLHKIEQEYEELVQICPDNHSSRDYQLFKSENWKEFEITFLSSRLSFLIIWVENYWLYVSPLVILPMLAVLTYGSCN